MSSSTSSTPLPPVLRSRLLPRISLGLLFLLTTMGALLAAVARAAGQGVELAIAGIAGVSFVGICFLLFGALFLFCRVVAVVKQDQIPEVHDGSPFAAGQLPTQTVPPREPRQ